jgi:hypothetical protein
MKHNKKRNTAFIYEVLVRELSKSVVQGNAPLRSSITEIFREFFKSGKTLSKELECYKALSEVKGVDKYNAEKMIFRAKHQHSEIPTDNLIQEKNQIIKKIHKSLGASVFSNFVPNYKTYATISQIFNDKTPLGKKVLMENKIVELLTGTDEEPIETMKPVDNLVVNSFSERFNKKYAPLLPEQKELLSKYIVSFGVNEADFRVYLIGELKRLHEAVSSSLVLAEIKDDPEMVKSTQSVLELVEAMNVSEVAAPHLRKILKLQTLVSEYEAHAN